MTQEQREQIVLLRTEGKGYTSIARALNLSINTVKTFCRRNAMAGKDRKQESCPSMDPHQANNNLIYSEYRGNMNAAGSPETPDHAAGSNHPLKVSVSYAEIPDQSAVSDVLNLLMRANYGR